MFYQKNVIKMKLFNKLTVFGCQYFPNLVFSIIWGDWDILKRKLIKSQSVLVYIVENYDLMLTSPHPIILIFMRTICGNGKLVLNIFPNNYPNVTISEEFENITIDECSK